MITLTITGNDTAEFLKNLSVFLAIGTDTDTVTGQPEETKTRKPRITKAETPAAAAAAAAAPAPTVAPTVAPPENDGLEDDGLGTDKVYTQDEIKKIGREHASRVGADKVRDFIKSLGAENLTKLPAEKYNEFAEGVAKLKP